MKKLSYIKLLLLLVFAGYLQAEDKVIEKDIKIEKQARAVIDSVNEAIGLDSLAKLKSIKIVYKISIEQQNIAFDQEVFSKGGKILTALKMGPVEILQGYDGKVAWAKDPMMGNRLLGGEEAFVLKMSSVDYMSKWFEAYDTISLKGEKEIDGVMCHELVLGKKGMDDAHYFINKATNLPYEMRMSYKQAMGKMLSTTRFNAYKDHDMKFKLPSNFTIDAAKTKMTAEVKSIKIDEDVDDNIFMRPKE